MNIKENNTLQLPHCMLTPGGRSRAARDRRPFRRWRWVMRSRRGSSGGCAGSRVVVLCWWQRQGTSPVDTTTLSNNASSLLQRNRLLDSMSQFLHLQWPTYTAALNDSLLYHRVNSTSSVIVFFFDGKVRGLRVDRAAAHGMLVRGEGTSLSLPEGCLFTRCRLAALSVSDGAELALGDGNAVVSNEGLDSSSSGILVTTGGRVIDDNQR